MPHDFDTLRKQNSGVCFTDCITFYECYYLFRHNKKPVCSHMFMLHWTKIHFWHSKQSTFTFDADRWMTVLDIGPLKPYNKFLWLVCNFTTTVSGITWFSFCLDKRKMLYRICGWMTVLEGWMTVLAISPLKSCSKFKLSFFISKSRFHLYFALLVTGHCCMVLDTPAHRQYTPNKMRRNKG